MTRIPEDVPPGLVCCKRTQVFSARNAPWSLLKAHSTALYRGDGPIPLGARGLVS